MSTTVLVTGGMGTLGREIVKQLVSKQYRTRVLSRQGAMPVPAGVELISGDLGTGSGLNAAVAGIDTIIHCASAPRNAQRVDVEGTRLLLQAVQNRSTHIIYPSIVGIDRSTFSYYQAKRAAEEIIEHAILPWTILRATQFHNLVLNILQGFGVDTQSVVKIPGHMRFQSIDVSEVAAQLVTLVEQGPAGHIPDMGGPEILTIAEMTTTYLHIQGREAIIQEEPPTGDMFQAFTSGVNLVPDHAVGKISWETFLRRTKSVHG